MRVYINIYGGTDDLSLSVNNGGAGDPIHFRSLIAPNGKFVWKRRFIGPPGEGGGERESPWKKTLPFLSLSLVSESFVYIERERKYIARVAHLSQPKASSVGAYIRREGKEDAQAGAYRANR